MFWLQSDVLRIFNLQKWEGDGGADLRQEAVRSVSIIHTNTHTHTHTHNLQKWEGDGGADLRQESCAECVGGGEGEAPLNCLLRRGAAYIY